MDDEKVCVFKRKRISVDGALNTRCKSNLIPTPLRSSFTRLSPVGICSLIAAKLAAMDHIGKAFEMLGYLMGTAIAGLVLHGVIILPLIYFIFTRKNPIIYIKNLSDAIATAYGTDSRCVSFSKHNA